MRMTTWGYTHPGGTDHRIATWGFVLPNTYFATVYRLVGVAVLRLIEAR